MRWLFRLLCELIEGIFPPPAYDVDPRDLPMNQDGGQVAPDTPTFVESVPVITAGRLLEREASRWIGKDASPKNLAPKEVSCAECIVHITNNVWPGTLDPRIVGTDELERALRRSNRFEAALDPEIGSIIVFPRTATVNGHALVCVDIVDGTPVYASNDSLTGLFYRNYTRQSARNYFIVKKGLKGYIFTPRWLSTDPA